MTPSKGIHLDIGFAQLELFEDYLIGTINEGVIFDIPEFDKFHEVFESHYHDRQFCYISNRKNDYTINPNGYKSLKNYKLNLVGVASLCYSKASLDTANFAGQFFDWPHKAFYSMEECKEWIAALMKKKKKADL